MFSLALSSFSILYIVLGINVFLMNKKSLLNRLFLIINLSLFIWSFASALYISAYTLEACIFWYKVSSIGCFLFIGVILHFFLEYTQKQELLKKWWIYIFLYLPCIVFSYLEITKDFYAKAYVLKSSGWIVSARTDSIWFWVWTVQFIVFICICIGMSYVWGKKSISKRERKQTRVIYITATISLLIGLVIMVVVSILGVDIPDITPLTGVCWALGIFYAIVKYRLMAMTPSFIAENLFQTIIDSVILVDPKGMILTINPETKSMLGYDQAELVGESLEKLFFQEDRSKKTYITKLLDASPVRNKETFLISKSGVRIPIILSISECKDTYDTRIGFVLASKDITEYKSAEESIQYLATHDSLTGLPNRLMLLQILGHTIEVAKRYNRKFAIFFIDLDRFKMINDTKGHDAGDQLLQEIAKRYTQTLRAADVVSRQGGDEFIVLIDDVHKASDLRLIARNILANTYKPVILQGDECRVTASIGISVYPKDGEDAQVLMKHADMAMYYAKEEGKNDFQFYSEDILSELTGRLDIEQNLRFALERNELSLHYQAKVNLKTGAITGVEALLRWQSPQLGSITPTQFIPVAEETGMILSIGRWVLKQACLQNVAWQKQGLPAVCMAVNLSLKQLTDTELVHYIEAALDDSGMAPNLLELEITESMIMSNPKKMRDVLVRIKSMGVRLAIDDFGTGYSSLAQLKHFPIDTLKIDRSFIRNVPDNSEDKAITHAIIAMGETLGFAVVAEGVETLEQMNYLKGQACDEMQGFYFSKPVVPEEFALLLQKQSISSAG